jgi:hypothetical protein
MFRKIPEEMENFARKNIKCFRNLLIISKLRRGGG